MTVRGAAVALPSVPTVMAVNLYHGGHHPQHLECLLAYWAKHELAGELHFVVSETYRDEHPSLLARVDTTPRAERHLVPASNLPTNDRRQLLSSDRRHGRVVSEWARKLEADHVLLMYFDHVQLSLASDLRFTRPLGISGIYFRPTFYYRELELHRKIKERISAARKQLVLRAALRNPHVRYVFCFDHLAVEHFPRTRASVRAVRLPEPLYEAPTHAGESPIAGRVEPGRRRLLMFGSLDERKGLGMALEALSRLGPTEQAQLGLVLAGRVSGAERETLLERIESLRTTSNVQVVLEDRYLEEEEIQPLVESCELVLLTYVHHIGSSGVLVRAARAGVPVLSTNYGLLGVQVAEHRLGETVDTRSAAAITGALERWLADPESVAFESDRARAFAAANTADAFAETILSRVFAQDR